MYCRKREHKRNIVKKKKKIVTCVDEVELLERVHHTLACGLVKNIIALIIQY